MLRILWALVCVSFVVSVKGHGLFFSPIVGSPKGLVRGIEKLSFQIDSLRSPATLGNVCRGETAKSPVTPITLVNGQSHTIVLALSIGAQHVGPCTVEIRDANNINAPGVVIASANGCARPPIAEGAFDNKGIPADQQCPGKVPPGLVTNDMCLTTWTFTVQNADKITCGDHCVMRWTWEGQHVSPSEHYENCADVSIVGGGPIVPPTTTNPIVPPATTNVPIVPPPTITNVPIVPPATTNPTTPAPPVIIIVQPATTTIPTATVITYTSLPTPPSEDETEKDEDQDLADILEELGLLDPKEYTKTYQQEAPSQTDSTRVRRQRRPRRRRDRRRRRRRDRKRRPRPRNSQE